MHSSDFMPGFKDEIDGKDRAGWEAEFEIGGMVAHLNGLGWGRYQWRHTPSENDRKCFAEFFSEFYHGYLRGDGKTVREAVEQCLNRGQRFAKCERETGHNYLPFKASLTAKEYSNGLIACVHCGFNGCTTMVESLRQQVTHYRIHAEVSQDRAAEAERYIEEHGETWKQSLDRRIKEQQEKSVAKPTAV